MATKATTKKAEAKAPAKKAEVKAEVKATPKKAANLPKELFSGEVNKALLAQAVRVYLANQREGAASTKTRGEVEGSTRKIFKQKGTGRARHGGIRAPIFVGGGITFGPTPRDYTLGLNKKMKRAALISALSARKEDVSVVADFDLKAPKTKTVADALKAENLSGSILFVVPKKAEILIKAARNIANVEIMHATDIQPYAVLTHKHVVFTASALEECKAHFTK